MHKDQNMIRRTLVILIFLISIPVFSQESHQELAGNYYSTKNSFERESILILSENGRFNYKYVIGGCQGEISGNWTVINDNLQLDSDNEYETVNDDEQELITVNDSIQIEIPNPVYPDLSLVRWKIGNSWLKPLKKIDTGCLIVNEKHLKD